MRILIADDEPNIRESLRGLLELEGMEAVCAADGGQARRFLDEGSFDLALLDLKMPVLSGQEVLEWIVQEGLNVPVILISAHGEIADAVRALKSGARDFLEKPFDAEELLRVIRATAREGAAIRAQEATSRTAAKRGALVGEHPSIREIRAFIEKIADAGTTVLITGESGTGKEVVAREIHERSRRAQEPFVAVNLGGLPDNLIESELFGYEKGAFTSAASRKLGLCELAGSGTLFLDEIGEMPAHVQVKLLRVLQDRRVRRLGGTRDIPIGARIVSATNRDLEREVKAGRFREDLFFRLNVLRISVPPLRDRISDLGALAAALLERISDRTGGRVLRLAKDAERKLAAYPFPGNIRELENILERASIFAEGEIIRPEDIDLREVDGVSAVPTPPSSQPSEPFSGPLRDEERRLIEAALARHAGNRTRAAEELGISRRTILYKIKRYGL